jgi:predicted transcriptional regulator
MNPAYSLIAKYSKSMTSESKIAVLHSLGSGKKFCRDIYQESGISSTAIQFALKDLAAQGLVGHTITHGLKQYYLTKPDQTIDFMNNLGLFALDVEKVS